jgi:hypothetical protein
MSDTVSGVALARLEEVDFGQRGGSQSGEVAAGLLDGDGAA